MNNEFSWVDLVSLAVAVVSLIVTLAIFHLGRRLSFRQQRERVRELKVKAWEVLTPMRTEGLNSKIIVMNVARYKRGYNGSNKITWRGGVYSGPELIEVVHGGVEVILAGVESYYDPDHGRTLTKTDRRAPPVIRCGHIPWKWIEDISPEGDEFDGSAIFFVRHSAPGRQPYDFITYREGTAVPFGPNDRDYYRPIPELGILRPKLIRDWWNFGRSMRHLKQLEKRGRRLQAGQRP